MSGAAGEPLTWGELHAEALDRLGAPHEARWIVEEASGSEWPACADGPVLLRAGRRFEDMVARRAAGEPLQYVLGHWSFRTLDLMVDRRVLIPRPETEQVVEVALGELDRVTAAAAPVQPTVVDLGTGSGAIALAIAAERPRPQVWATDASPSALDVARANAAGLGGRAAARVRFAEGHWWQALPAQLRGGVHLAVSNPPYIGSDEMRTLDPTVARWEPHHALEAGPTGLEDLTTILAGAAEWLAPAGVVVLELAPHQAEAARAEANRAGFAEAEIRRDLTGRDRALVARRP